MFLTVSGGYHCQMQITLKQTGTELSLTAEPSEGDRELAKNATLLRRTATLKLPEGFSRPDTHPDLLALTALIAFYPWIGTRLDLELGVSQEFADVVKKVSRIDVTNVDSELGKRRTAADAKPGLSFSGGVDSMAALALMPDNTVPVFSLRTPPPNGGHSLYKPDVALHAIAEMKKAGKVVHVVETDHEWVREPVGFAVDAAPALPLILMADVLNFDAITFGTISESAYATGAGKWAEYAERVAYTRWAALFEAVGLAFYNPTVGISEVGTSTIVLTSEFGHLAQSCIRGIPEHPCKACVKCFRKSLITAALTGQWPDSNEVSRMMANRTIKAFLEKVPIRFEIILTAAMASYNGNDPLLLALQDRVGAKVQNVSFVHTWYPPAMDLLPEKYRAATIDAANKYLPGMNAEQVEAFQGFDIAPFLDAKKDDIKQFLELLEENAKPRKTV